jgi:ribonuclease HII
VPRPKPTETNGSTGKALSASALKQRLLKSLKCTTSFEKAAWLSGARLVAGVDEVGRGALFGCVAAAACILNPADRIRGLRDSKLLDAEEREKLAVRIRRRAIAWAVAEVDASRIDQVNIYQASLLAMKLAVERLQPCPDFLLVDAAALDVACAQRKIIHGDALSASIAAASILAKVHRDAIVREWDAIYPQYGLASNKGYATPAHKLALQQHGPTPLHRQSYAPVRGASEDWQQELEFADELSEEEAECGVDECGVDENNVEVLNEESEC